MSFFQFEVAIIVVKIEETDLIFRYVSRLSRLVHSFHSREFFSGVIEDKSKE